MPHWLARWKSVSVLINSAEVMYSTFRLGVESRIGVMPCLSGQLPQQIDTLLTLVTLGKPPVPYRTALPELSVSGRHLSGLMIGESQAVEHADNCPLVLVRFLMVDCLNEDSSRSTSKLYPLPPANEKRHPDSRR